MKIALRDAYMIGVVVIGAGGLLASAGGWIPMWLGVALLFLSLVAALAGVAFFAWKADVPPRQILIGLGLTVLFAAGMGAIGMAWARFMAR